MLSVVALPIGNLGDITLRAIEVLTSCDAIVCEDTRETGMLLKHLEIPKKELISMHSYSDPKKLDLVLQRLSKNEHIALVSDRGTPGISDPGFRLITETRKEGFEIESIPGCSAFLAALSICGLPINTFTYLGFLPQKKGRQSLLESFVDEHRTIVFYESVHRIEKTLLQLSKILSQQPERRVVIARELTKMHEEILSTDVARLKDEANKIMKKGEFVVVIEGA